MLHTLSKLNEKRAHLQYLKLILKPEHGVCQHSSWKRPAVYFKLILSVGQVDKQNHTIFRPPYSRRVHSSNKLFCHSRLETCFARISLVKSESSIAMSILIHLNTSEFINRNWMTNFPRTQHRFATLSEQNHTTNC